MEPTPPYGFGITLSTSFPEAIRLTKEAFQAEGFGALTEIDVKKALEEKLGLTKEPYTILGMCNPHLAAQAIQMEPAIGLLLPCNVLVASKGSMVEVLVQDPILMMDVTHNPALQPVAQEARARLEAALKRLAESAK